jgi:transposase InsO family protein
VSDYYSNFIEVENLNKATSNNVSKALRTMFARQGVPDILISDNGSQFASEEFATFAI